MCDFKRLYFQLFAAMADATEALEQGDYDRARQILISAQQNAEEQYISAEQKKGAPGAPFSLLIIQR